MPKFQPIPNFDSLAPTTTKGDLIVRSSSTNSRLGVGSDGQVLTLDSLQTLGVKWAAVSAGAMNVVSKTTTYSAVINDYILASSSSFTITLPTAVGVSGQQIVIQHAGTSLSQVYTLNTTSSQTIGGIASGSYALYTNGEVLSLVSDGANWQIMNHKAETDWSASVACTIAATTTNPTKGNSPTVDSFRWRRKGTDLHGRIYFKNSTATGSAAGSGDYKFQAVPTNASIDTTKCQANSTTSGWAAAYTNAFAVGSCNVGDGTNEGPGSVVVYDSTYVRMFQLVTGVNAGAIGSGGFPLSSAAVFYALDYVVPITGWQP